MYSTRITSPRTAMIVIPRKHSKRISIHLRPVNSAHTNALFTLLLYHHSVCHSLTHSLPPRPHPQIRPHPLEQLLPPRLSIRHQASLHTHQLTLFPTPPSIATLSSNLPSQAISAAHCPSTSPDRHAGRSPVGRCHSGPRLSMLRPR
jgi:hypothetical protein